jgi:hypothetical protein
VVAAFARCYLVLIGKKVESSSSAYILSSIQDILFTHSHLHSNYMRMYLTKNCITEVSSQYAQPTQSVITKRQGQYLLVCAPAVDWILKALGKDASKVRCRKLKYH